MRRSRFVIGLATAILGASLPTKVPARGQRDGVRISVVDVDSGVPILRARLAPASAAPLPLTFTDGRGVATVDVPQAGRTLQVTKAGYAPQTVTVDGTADVLDVKLARGAAIGGRVIDMTGAAVAGRNVRIETAAKTSQPPRLVATNDIGEYRIGSLPEGTYAVSLAPPPGSPPQSAEGVVHTVIVRRGDEVSGIDFTTPRATCSLATTIEPGVTGSGFGTITGRVVNASGAPIPCVEVVALRGPGRVAATMTDTGGRYLLRGVRAGSYPIEFKRPGYVTLQWGQHQAGQPGRPVRLRDRETVSNIDIRLPRGSAVTGTLFDEFGEPADNVTVRALELRGETNRPMAVGVSSAVTDDRGRYRLGGLPPGRFLVSTAASTDPPDPRTGKGYAPAYYPGASEIASARPVEVLEERETQWIDFGREPVRVATITGTAVNSLNAPVTDRVLLVASQRSGAVIAETQGAEVKGADGAFTIPNVPPGDYVLQATSKRTDGGEGKEFGMQYVTVYQDDPPALRVKTAAGLDVSGRLTQDGAPLVDPRAFAITAVPVDWDQTSILSGTQTVTPADDGTITMLGVSGPRRLLVTASPSNWYLKSIRTRGRDVTDEVAGFPVTGFGFIRDLEVVVSNKGAVVEGEVMDGSSPASDASIVLFSSNPEHWFPSSRFVKSVRGNEEGRFRIEGIADGEYFLTAIDPLGGTAGTAWQDPEFLRSLTITARRLRLREGDERNLTLTLTHR